MQADSEILPQPQDQPPNQDDSGPHYLLPQEDFEISAPLTPDRQVLSPKNPEHTYESFKKENENLFKSRDNKKNILIASIVFSVISSAAIFATYGVLNNPAYNFLLTLISIPITVNLLCLRKYYIANKKLKKKKDEFSSDKFNKPFNLQTIISHTITKGDNSEKFAILNSDSEGQESPSSPSQIPERQPTTVVINTRPEPINFANISLLKPLKASKSATEGPGSGTSL